jgi:hypothetical protein
MSAAAPALPLTLSEAAFQRTVMDLAVRCGWRVVHVPTTPTKRGGRVVYSTPYSGHAGLPDLILARGGVLLLVELKSQQGRATPEQRAWLAAAGVHGRLWKPSNFAEVVEVLR